MTVGENSSMFMIEWKVKYRRFLLLNAW